MQTHGTTELHFSPTTPQLHPRTIYTADDAPSAPRIDDLPREQTLSQHGITWTLKDPVPVGRFVNGDAYVVGPATVTGITPAPQDGLNGSVLNLPPTTHRSGFDSRTHGNRYDQALRIDLPCDLVPGDSLVSTTSVENAGERTRLLFPSKETVSPVGTAAVLTCLSEPAPADAFRPSYSDRDNAIYLSRNLRRDLLPMLPRVGSTPPIADWSRLFQGPWIDTVQFGFDAPIDIMPDYGRDVCRAGSIASLLLMLDFPVEEKEPLLQGFVQYGIDLWGVVRSGHPGWPAHGGHGNGRKWPMVFAGIMLDDSGMQSPKSGYPDLKLSEDMQTIYGKGWTGADAVYGGHVGPDGEAREEGWGPYEHLRPEEWRSMIGEGYRRCCTSVAWVGTALAAHILHAEETWNHPPFFDYVDRWMTEEDSAFLEVVEEITGRDFSGLPARTAWDPFVDDMWETYRHDLP